MAKISFFPKIQSLITNESTNTVTRTLKQYSDFPYPDIPILALPKKLQAHVLAYELGQYLRTGHFHPHNKNTRILVAGCGTFEPIVIAQAHPKAKIIALDLSIKNLKILRKRAYFARIQNRIEFIQADLHEPLNTHVDNVDYILCSGVLHHSPKPEVILKNLTSLLNTKGLMRLMVYPKHSRLWIYELQMFFKQHGLHIEQKNAKKTYQRALHLISNLPRMHPLRTSFENYSDAKNISGFVDGFFHTYDRPFAFSDLHKLCLENSLYLMGLSHHWHSQPAAFSAELKRAQCPEHLLYEFQNLPIWDKLDILDTCGELTVNPILWLAKELEDVKIQMPKITTPNPVLKKNLFSIFISNTKADAPLMPTGGSTLISQDYLNFKNLKPFEQKRKVLGGWLIGSDGALPEELFQLREHKSALQEKIIKTKKIEPLFSLNPSFIKKLSEHPTHLPVITKYNFKFWNFNNQHPITVPSPVRHKILLSLSHCLQHFNHAQETWVELLAKILESRTNYANQDLPGLSFGDLLRDLQKRKFQFKEILEILHTFPEPPTEEQWNAIYKNKTPQILNSLTRNGAERWFIAIESI